MSDRFLADLIGTLRSYFRINSVRLKDDSGLVAARNASDTAYVDVASDSINLYGSGASAIVHTVASGVSGSTYSWDDDGNNGQVLSTDGAGSLSWISMTSNGELVEEESFTEATSSPLTIFTPQANAVITQVQVEVATAAGGGNPTVEVGIAGDTGRDMSTSESDLNTQALYTVRPNTDVGASPSSVILTIAADSQTFTGEVRVWSVVPQ